jgi:hypothetical protein
MDSLAPARSVLRPLAPPNSLRGLPNRSSPAISPSLRGRSYAGELTRRVNNPERVCIRSRQSHRAWEVMQPFQGCAGFGHLSQGSSVRAGLASLATRGLRMRSPLGLRKPGGLVGNAQRSPLALSPFLKNNFKILGVMGRRKTPWTGDTTNQALVA